MNFVIVGAGALGSIYAAYLARDGNKVSLVARGERATALARHGIGIEGADAFTVHCDIVTRPETLRNADVAIVAIKTYDTEQALATLRGLKVGTAFSVQNGVLKNKLLADVFGTQTTLGAVSMVGGEVLSAEGGRPAAIRYSVPGPTIIGELDGGDSTRAREIVDTFVKSGLKAQVSNDITSVEWSKFVGWSGLSSLAILTRQPTWRFLVDADTALIAARVMRETAAVAMRHGVTLQDSGFSSKDFIGGTEEHAVKFIQAHGEKMKINSPTFRQSILQDADRNRRLEVNETLKYALTMAKDLGVAAPMLEYCCRILGVVSRAAG
ncbi:MAG: ketopantoate reductase family protein [Burkholderiales bacterium]